MRIPVTTLNLLGDMRGSSLRGDGNIEEKEVTHASPPDYRIANQAPSSAAPIEISKISW